MQKITCAIIDDEPLAANLLTSYAQKISFLEVAGTYNSAVAAMSMLRESPVDLIFLDIQMPELSGMELAKLLPSTTRIIFTTAFSQYAIESYRVHAIDYLLKPISFDDFRNACNNALTHFPHPSVQRIARIHQHPTTDRFLFVKSEYKLVRIDYDSIIYVEGLKDYVKIYFDNGNRPLLSLMNMKTIEERLPSPEFLRTHRSYIVHMSKIRTVDRLRIVFGDNYIPISDNYKEEVMAYLEAHTLS